MITFVSESTPLSITHTADIYKSFRLKKLAPKSNAGLHFTLFIYEAHFSRLILDIILSDHQEINHTNYRLFSEPPNERSPGIMCVQYIRGCSVHWEAILSTLGVILSTLKEANVH